ncbi:MAG: Enoyl-CoA hydratase/isomerase [Solirubrobacterales bacterium]|jgi:2-(1,2-epoxy-1,2-dihydrophenyl)acetyl-CoA isomerase|nr:Enoyl-CoA hydratase/isomerase [Solirubrobacterales bacterium]
MGTVDLTRRADGVAVLTIEGAIDLTWAQALREHARALEADGDARVVLVTAGGRFFCPGGDLAWMAAQPDAEAALAELAGTLHEALVVLRGLAAPVVARVHGAAAGAGFSLVMGADVALAGASATFTMAYAGVGLSPDGGASWLLPRLVGRRRAAEIMLTDRRIGAEEAERIGLVTRTVADEELVAETEALVAKLAAGPTASYAAIKRLLDSSWGAGLEEQFDAEAASIAALAAGPTGQEGIAAFLAKRRPEFA